MNNRKKLLFSAAVIMTFLLSYYGRRIIGFSFSTPIASTIYYYAWWFLPTVVTTGVLFGFPRLASTLGLDKNLPRAFAFALVAVSPMFIGSAIIGEMNLGQHWLDLLRGTLFAGLFEEYFFRGFLFGILFRKLGWGFIPAGILGAVFFGMGHLYQGVGFAQTAGIFLVTAIGSLWFAWLYIEWDENLWVPIFLHILMNLSWTLFEVGGNALGDLYLNVFRAVTIALTVIATIRRNKAKGMAINRSNLFTGET